jgi:hypothetical protein
MGEWQPDNISDISSRDTVYFWVVPANVSGTWQLTAPGINGGEPYTLSLTQKFQKVVATLKAGNAQIPVKDVKLIGDRLEFVAEMNVNGNPVRRRFTGKTDGDTMKGVFEPDEAGRENTWQAERDPSTAVLLEEPGGAGEKNNRF